jgi:hypothetical protein
MKKIYSLLLLIASASIVYGQSQRLVLFEEFTQASCPPCASTNPALNALLNANASKVVSIKYQTSWPGYDPMNLQNPTEVQSRVDYYSVPYVPYGRMDGGIGFSGQPQGLTQTMINNRYAVSSPFDMVMTHSFSANYDSVFITCNITATQAVSGSLVAQIAIIERDIYFTTPPGSNGETHFQGEMKKMLPDANGTALPSTWNVSDSQTLTFALRMPWYIYDLNQIAIVGFVQNNANKDVQQAAYSQPIGGVPTTLDASIVSVTNIPSVICTSSFVPSMTIQNNAATTLTSLNINYSLDNGPISSFPWTGSLITNATSVIIFPSITASGGQHSISIWTSDPNGGIDYKPVNNHVTKSFVLVSSYYAAPLTEGYEAATFPPTDWFIVNNDNGITWTRSTDASGFGLSTACAKMDFFNSPSGQADEFYFSGVDMSNVTSPANLTFNVAYAQLNVTHNDRLVVEISNNCGLSWTYVYNKTGPVLATAPYYATAFIPAPTEWRAETVNLDSYAGSAGIIVKFVGNSNHGNNLYVDDINLNGTPLGIYSTSLDNHINIYPNPASDKVYFNLSFDKSQDVKVEILNLVGEKVAYQEINNTVKGIYPVDISTLANGSYIVRISAGTETIVKPLQIAK